MNLLARFRGWRRKRRRMRAARRLNAALREFVYLDEVSVFSLIASRLGPVASEFTDTETSSLKNETQGTLGATAGVLKGQVRSRLETTQTRSSQVLRKATVQATFRELYGLEESNLALRPFQPNLDPPRVRTLDDLRAGFGETAFDGWLIGPNDWRRGQLFEAEVELAADPIFRLSASLTALVDIISDSPELFPNSVLGQLGNSVAINRVLDRMMVGLIPVRGRVTDYKIISLRDDEPILVHNKLLAQVGDLAGQTVEDLFIVGVTEQRLYWKDDRQVLYSGARYKALCRISAEEMSNSWTPVKMVDLLGGLVPDLPRALAEFGETAFKVLAGADPISKADDSRAQHMQSALVEYARVAIEDAGVSVEPDVMQEVERVSEKHRDNFSDLSARRAAFEAVRDVLKIRAGISQGADQAADLRVKALSASGLSLDGQVEAVAKFVPNLDVRALFLESEIIAIYW